MTTVIVVLGSGHSGSTLLDLLLGTQPGLWSAGEVVQRPGIYRRPDAEESCTCGRPIVDCSFWASVRAIAPPEGEAEPPRRRAALEAVAAVSGAEVLVDSSKQSSYVAGLLDEGVDARVVHLVRDARAVAHSHARKGRDFGPSIRKWVSDQAKAQRVLDRFPAAPRTTVRYEDLVRDPAAALTRILASLLGRAGAVDAWRGFRARETHLIAGNRMRFSDDAEVRFDDRFLAEVTSSEWWRGTVEARATLREFGYPLRRRGYLAHV